MAAERGYRNPGLDQRQRRSDCDTRKNLLGELHFGPESVERKEDLEMAASGKDMIRHINICLFGKCRAIEDNATQWMTDPTCLKCSVVRSFPIVQLLQHDTKWFVFN